MPSSRFRPLHPRASLRRLRTVFSSTSPHQSPTSRLQTATTANCCCSSTTAATNSISQSTNTTTTSTSPLSATAGSRLSTFSTLSLGSSHYHSSSRLLPRNEHGHIEGEQCSPVGREILSLVEPRPSRETTFGGIEEILLDGRA